MIKSLLSILIFSLYVSTVAYAEMPKYSLYLDGGASKTAVILAHGQGQGPDSKVVDPLRKALNKEIGIHTLSLQMPTLSGKFSPDKFKEYEAVFPEAYKTIKAGIDFLRNEKGVERIYLMGYSMGGRMTTAFLAENPDSGIAGYIGVGLLAGGEAPLNSNINLKQVKIPVLDIYAENDRDAKFAENRQHFVSERFKQVPIPGAKHDYGCCESAVNAAAIGWLKIQETKR